MSKSKTPGRSKTRTAQGPWSDLALHTLGWKSFQDLCAHVSEEILQRPVEIYREAQDGGQDAVFLSKKSKGRKKSKPATIQCKFTSKFNRHLKPGDLTAELKNVVELKSAGNADTYIFMTNMSVDAPVAVAIRKRLRKLGVLHPHIFGSQFLTRVIRTSPRLRALVPRIYGLGDLSTILDERQAEQTKALLGHMMPTLKVYVPTKPHIQAVHTLAEHGIVLLLGDPATGKSSIAAILSTTAAEQHDCYKTDGPLELPANWNPNEPGKLFWIDDAFGPNQMRDDFVDHWINIMPKIQAAIANGDRFILTSRRHIYQAAKLKLGSRNHPMIRDGRVVVNVGELTPDERHQILYNHIRLGSQSRSWKSRVKPQLDSLANEPSFLPEIARRLGDSAYTKQISTANDDLLNFIRDPKEHLLQTIQELTEFNKATLTLVFLHSGNMPNGKIDTTMQELVVTHFGVDIASLGKALLELQDSFLVKQYEDGNVYWAFKHPTIADALSTLLGETEGMAELYLRGVKSETILSEVICAENPSTIQDAVVIPSALNNLLVERLSELPDEPGINRLLFSFLHGRASDDLLKMLVSKHSLILSRKAHASWSLEYDPKILAHGRAYGLGILPPKIREVSGLRIERALFEDLDASFLENNTILALIEPIKLLQLSRLIREDLLPTMITMVDEFIDHADLDIEPSDNFDDLTMAVRSLETIFEDDEDAQNNLEEVQDTIEGAIAKVTQRKEQKEQEEYDEDWNWEDLAPGGRQKTSLAASASSNDVSLVHRQDRSIFSDVDE